jgi:hypothetical protein
VLGTALASCASVPLVVLSTALGSFASVPLFVIIPVVCLWALQNFDVLCLLCLAQYGAWYAALDRMPVSRALALGFVSPAFNVALARRVRGEPVSWHVEAQTRERVVHGGERGDDDVLRAAGLEAAGPGEKPIGVEEERDERGGRQHDARPAHSLSLRPRQEGRGEGRA